MPLKTYIWKGPPTVLDVRDASGQEIYCGSVVHGSEIPVPLPDDHSQVVGWLAFKLLVEKPSDRPTETKPQPEAKTKKDSAE